MPWAAWPLSANSSDTLNRSHGSALPVKRLDQIKENLYYNYLTNSKNVTEVSSTLKPRTPRPFSRRLAYKRDQSTRSLETIGHLARRGEIPRLRRRLHRLQAPPEPSS